MIWAMVAMGLGGLAAHAFWMAFNSSTGLK